MNTAINAEDVRARVRELPALPKAVHEIMQAINDENLALEAFARKIAIDPAMVTKILRAANSPFYGISGSIGSVHDAVRLIGLRTVGALLTTAAVMHSIAPPACEGFDFHGFWEHSLGTAICSQELARECESSQTLAFTAGLLHDIGRLALATYYPRELASAIAFAKERDCALHEAERCVLGIGHPEVGAWIAAHWHFADLVVEAIRQHHDPAGDHRATALALADIVHSADGIAHALDLTRTAGDLVPPLQLAAWERLQLAPEFYLQLFERTEAGYEGLRDVLIA
jgi:putative nucleotidyltransferase with HDIG domain